MSRNQRVCFRLCAGLFASACAANASAAAALFGNITAKAGAQNARVWTLAAGNSGSDTATSTAISSLALNQVAGAACTPVVTGPFPLALGDIASGASASAPVTIDFTGCAAAARFVVTFVATANAGAATATVARYNQFR